MSLDFQSDMDTLFFDENSVFSEEITGTPADGEEITIYANVERYGVEMGKIKGGYEQSFRQISIQVSKTDWPIVTKNKDKFEIPVGGTIRIMRVSNVLYEDSTSYKLALI